MCHKQKTGKFHSPIGMDVDTGAITVAVDNGADRELMLIAGTAALTCIPPATTESEHAVGLDHTNIAKHYCRRLFPRHILEVRSPW